MTNEPVTVEQLAGVPENTVLPDNETVVGDYVNLPSLDANGNPELDADGNVIYVLDDNGNPVQTAIGWHKENR